MRARKGGDGTTATFWREKKIISKVYLKLNFVYYNELYLCIIYINIYNVSNIWKINKNYNKEQTFFVFDTPEMLLKVFNTHNSCENHSESDNAHGFFFGSAENHLKPIVIPS